MLRYYLQSSTHDHSNNLVRMQGQLRSAELTEIDTEHGSQEKTILSAHPSATSYLWYRRHSLGPSGTNATHQKSIAALSGTYAGCAPMGTCVYKLYITTSDSPTTQPTLFFAVI